MLPSEALLNSYLAHSGVDRVLKYTVIQRSGLCSLIFSVLSVITQIRSNLRAMQAEPRRSPEDAPLIEEAQPAGSWCFCRCIAGRLLMFFQWDQCQGFVLSVEGRTMVQVIPKAWTNCVQCWYSPLQSHWHLLSSASYLWPFIFCNILGCRSTCTIYLLFLCALLMTMEMPRFGNSEFAMCQDHISYQNHHWLILDIYFFCFYFYITFVVI